MNDKEKIAGAMIFVKMAKDNPDGFRQTTARVCDAHRNPSIETISHLDSASSQKMDCAELKPEMLADEATSSSHPHK